MEKYKVLKVTVDTNDGDYEDHTVRIEETCPKINKFLNTLKYLPVADDYYYWDGERKSRGKHIFWDHERVGSYLEGRECALKCMVIDEDQFKEEDWTVEEVYEEGMIMQTDYEILCEFLPMHINDGFGFHTIKAVSVELHTEPEVTFEYNIGG